MEVNFGEVAKNYAIYRNDLPVDLIPSLKAMELDFKNKGSRPVLWNGCAHASSSAGRSKLSGN